MKKATAMSYYEIAFKDLLSYYGNKIRLSVYCVCNNFIWAI